MNFHYNLICLKAFICCCYRLVHQWSKEIRRWREHLYNTLYMSKEPSILIISITISLLTIIFFFITFIYTENHKLTDGTLWKKSHDSNNYKLYSSTASIPWELCCDINFPIPKTILELVCQWICLKEEKKKWRKLPVVIHLWLLWFFFFYRMIFIPFHLHISTMQKLNVKRNTGRRENNKKCNCLWLSLVKEKHCMNMINA